MNATIHLEVKGTVLILTLGEIQELQKTLLAVAGASLPDQGYYVAMKGSVIPINWRDNSNFQASWRYMGT